MHCSLVGGQFGFHKTLARLRLDFKWDGMRNLVQYFIHECETCQRNKYDNMMPAGLLQPLPMPDQIWTKVTMDFIEGLPSSGGCLVIMIVVDRLSKYANFVPLSHPFTAVLVAKAFINNVVKLHGMPISVTSYRDRGFMSRFWKSLFQMQRLYCK